MGAVGCRYQFADAPSIDEIADRFETLTGLALMGTRDSALSWDLSASPLRGELEVARKGNTYEVVRFLSDSRYLHMTFRRTLYALGALQPPAPRFPAWALRRWDDLSWWRRWRLR